MQVELDLATGLAVRVSTVAGQTTRHHKHPDRQSEGCNGWADGNASVASFNYVHGTAFMPIPIDGTPDRGGGGAQGGSKHIYVCDEDNSRIRRVELSTRATITLAGSGKHGHKDGVGMDADFDYPGPADPTHCPSPTHAAAALEIPDHPHNRRTTD
jgi:hypothetical protein